MAITVVFAPIVLMDWNEISTVQAKQVSLSCARNKYVVVINYFSVTYFYVLPMALYSSFYSFCVITILIHKDMSQGCKAFVPKISMYLSIVM